MTSIVDDHGVPTSREFIATMIWQDDMGIRLEVMAIVPCVKSMAKRYRACIAYMVENMMEYQIEGNVLTGNLK